MDWPSLCKKKKYHAWKHLIYCHDYRTCEEYCKLRKSASKAVRFAKKKYQKRIAESIKTLSKSFWSRVKKETKSKSNIGGELKTKAQLFKANDVVS